MKVSDLAADLEVPASTILDQCQRFGIDAAWSGAELRNVDVAMLRAELAMADPLDLASADPDVAPPSAGAEPEAPTEAAEPEPPTEDAEAVEAPDPTAALPEADADAEVAPTPAVVPTAVGSMPELLNEITPEPEAPASHGPGFARSGAQGGGIDPNATRRVEPRPAPAKRRLESKARNSVVALLIAVACFAASNFTELAGVVALLWVLAAVALVVAVVDGVRGRRRVQVHPDRVHGAWLATISLVLACGGLVGLTTAVLAVIDDGPVTEAPARLGDLKSVQVGRWGYQRVSRLADNGWNQPARGEGSCWTADPSRPRDEQRVELADLSEGKSCSATHTMQAMKVFAVNRDADAPYPGTAKLLVLGQEECAAIGKRLTAKGVDITVKVEYPTEVGWNDGDHDVACVVVTPPRTAPLGA